MAIDQSVPETPTSDALRLRESDGIAELAKAMAVAQGQIADAIKDSENPHYKSSYADLASVWHACREALSANGLAVVQSPAFAGGRVLVTTRLIHASGQWLEGTLSIPVGKSDAHGIGSATTYARRYALAAMVGVAPDDDDDGNAAAESAQRSMQQRQTQRPADRRQAAIDASGGRLKPASQIEQPARGDDGDWHQWVTPPAEVEAGENPEWYIAAWKGLRHHGGARTAAQTRHLLAALWQGETPPTPQDVVSSVEMSRDAWERFLAAHKGGEVPFVRIVGDAIRKGATAEQDAGE